MSMLPEDVLRSMYSSPKGVFQEHMEREIAALRAIMRQRMEEQLWEPKTLTVDESHKEHLRLHQQFRMQQTMYMAGSQQPIVRERPMKPRRVVVHHEPMAPPGLFWVDALEPTPASHVPEAFITNATSSGQTATCSPVPAAAVGVNLRSKHPSPRSGDPLKYWTQMRTDEASLPTSTASPDKRP